MEMNQSHAGDMIDADGYSVEELREMVFEGQGRLDRTLALGLLSRKEYPDKVSDLRKVLANPAEQPRLRAAAASSLGQINTPAAVRALEGGLESGESLTIRAAARALANVGTRKHAEKLEELARDSGPLGRDAERALSVLRRRLKTNSPEFGPIDTLSVEKRREATPIRTRAASASDAAKAIKSAPGRKLVRRGSISLDCQGRRLVFVFDEAAHGQGLEVGSRAEEVGIVAEPPGIEGVAWAARYSVSVEPDEEGGFRIFATTLDGRPVLAGRGRREEGRATFELGAVDVPGALPVDIRGSFDGEKVTFDQARSGARRRSSRTPVAERRRPGSREQLSE